MSSSDPAPSAPSRLRLSLRPRPAVAATSSAVPPHGTSATAAARPPRSAGAASSDDLTTALAAAAATGGGAVPAPPPPPRSGNIVVGDEDEPPLKANRSETSTGPAADATATGAALRERLRSTGGAALPKSILEAAASRLVTDLSTTVRVPTPTPPVVAVPKAVNDKRAWKSVLKAVDKQQQQQSAAERKLQQRFTQGRQALLEDFAVRVKEIWTRRRLAALTGVGVGSGVGVNGGGTGSAKSGSNRLDADAEYIRLLEREIKNGSSGAEATLTLFKLLDAELNRAHAELAVMALNAGRTALLDSRPSEAHVMECLAAGGFEGQLMPFQMEGLQWLLTRFRCGAGAILADEMGLGKTVQAIALLHAIRSDAAAASRPSLVLVPLSTMGNWEGEFERFGGEKPMRVLALRGDGATCRALLRSLFPSPAATAAARRKAKKQGTGDAAGGATTPALNYDVVLVPHHRFSKTSDAVVRALLPVQWGYVVVDEAQRIKNAKSQMTQILLRTKSTHRLALTGTPLQNDLLELWSLMTFLLPTVFSKRENQLKLIFEHFTGRQKLDARKNGAFAETEEREVVLCTKLHQLFAPIVLRREKREVLSQLPSLQETTIYCPVTAPQQVALDEALKTTTHVHRTAAKVLLHPYAIQQTFLLDQDLLTNSGKFAVMDVILRFLDACHKDDPSQPPHKVLIFSSWIVTLDMVGYYCDWRGLKYVRLDGRVALEDRHAAMQRFAEDPDCRLFLISKGAGGVGLNLQSADTVLLLDVHYNPQSDLQALARAWRVGQRREVRVIRLVTDTAFERRVMDISSSKVAVEQKVIGAGRYNLHSTGAEREAILRDVLVGAAMNDAAAAEEAGSSSPKRFFGASGSTIDQLETHLTDSLVNGLCRGPSEVALMRKLIHNEGILHDLLASVARSPTSRGPNGLNGASSSSRAVSHKLHELRDEGLGSDASASAASSDSASSSDDGVEIVESDAEGNGDFFVYNDDEAAAGTLAGKGLGGRRRSREEDDLAYLGSSSSDDGGGSEKDYEVFMTL